MMTRYGMLIDLERCTGCLACRSACQRQNSLPADMGFIRYEHEEQEAFPNGRPSLVPVQCMHCEDAPCVSVCPTGASYVKAGGHVAVEEGKCIECLYCVAACPYQVRVRNEETGAVDKCRLCAVSGVDGSHGCTCVDVCPTQARLVGDLDDPDSEISRTIARRNAQPLSVGLTKAKIYYAR